MEEQMEAVERHRRGDYSEEFDTGVSTGYESLNELFRPVRGEVNVVSGQPGSGKSEFLLSLAVNLAKNHAWKTGLCVFEHKDLHLILQLLEKKTGQNFKDLTEKSLRADSEDIAWINRHFHLISDFSAELDMDTILDRAADLVKKESIQNLIIDPYNYISKPGGKNESETGVVSTYMTKLEKFAKKYKVCVWVVVHPSKASQKNKGAPSLYDLQGSAHWNNKCDKGIVLRRPNRKDPTFPTFRLLDVHVLKVRNGLSGEVGQVSLEFDAETRTYSDMSEELEELIAS